MDLGNGVLEGAGYVRTIEFGVSNFPLTDSNCNVGKSKGHAGHLKNSWLYTGKTGDLF